MHTNEYFLTLFVYVDDILVSSTCEAPLLRLKFITNLLLKKLDMLNIF